MMDANEEKQIQFEERLAFIIDGVLFSVFLEHLKQRGKLEQANRPNY